MCIRDSIAGLDEGGHGGSYWVRLLSQPLDDVTVRPQAPLLLSPASLTFNATNWDANQLVEVAIVDNDVDQGDGYAVELDHSVVSYAPSYAHVSVATRLVGIADDDVAGVSLSAMEDAHLDACGPTGTDQDGQLTPGRYVVNDGETFSYVSACATHPRLSACF